MSDTLEYYDEFQDVSQEQFEKESSFFSGMLEDERQHLFKEINKTNGDYAVVVPFQDAIYMNKVDAKVKADTEKLVAETLKVASFIVRYCNIPDEIDNAVKREITESTQGKYNFVYTIETPKSNLFILL